MHGDVQRLVAGGYSADEIIAAFVDTYGEQVLMAPKREGFNWAATCAVRGDRRRRGRSRRVIRRWGAAAAAASAARPVAVTVDATPEELARLEAAVRGEGS
jgi:cytochrome c-type biogenesis protein CcmH